MQHREHSVESIEGTARVPANSGAVLDRHYQHLKATASIEKAKTPSYNEKAPAMINNYIQGAEKTTKTKKELNINEGVSFELPPKVAPGLKVTNTYNYSTNFIQNSKHR